MPITVVCHKCGTLATVPDSAAGMQGKCEHCGNVVKVPGGAQKKCCVCHADVSYSERTKDAAGNYYCTQCAKAKQPAMEAAAAAKASTTPGTGTAGESATCAICRADVPRTTLHNFDGDLVCNACARKEGLGTTPYRIKKTRLGGRTLTYRCPHCQGELESAMDEAGKEDYCPQCGTAFEVPGRYEKFKAARPATTLRPESAVPVAARAMSNSATPLNAATRGRGKWLAIGALVVAAALFLALMVGYLVLKQSTAPPQAKRAVTQAGVAKATGAKVAATESVMIATATPTVNGAGGKAGATATPTPHTTSPAVPPLPPSKTARSSVATDLLNQLKAAVKVAAPAVRGPNLVAASLPGFRGLGADTTSSEVESSLTDEGNSSSVTISGTRAASTFPRWHAEMAKVYPHRFVQPEWRMMEKGRKSIIKMLAGMPLTGGGLAGFDHQNKLGANTPMVKFYRHRGGVAGLLFIDSTELYNSLRTSSMQRARMVFRAYAAKNIGAVANCMSAMGVPYCGVVVDYGIKRFGATDAVIHPRALVLIASCDLVNQFSHGHATIQMLMRKSDCFQENGSGGLFKIRVHY